MTTQDNASDKGSQPASFEDIALDSRILEQLDVMGFERPTPIQAESIPHLLNGSDIIAGARTGSGKTAAFGLPLLERLKDGGRHVRALVLSPTRELAQQISKALDEHAALLPKINAVTVYGGAPYPPQIRALKKGANVVVGTPGRLIDLLEKGVLDLSQLEMFVLDEADEMLRMGFIEDVERLLAESPEERQVALFSATMPAPIRRVANKYLKDAVSVEVESKALTVDHIGQFCCVVPGNRKVDALIRILKATDRAATLVFARTRVSCQDVAAELTRRGMSAEALHGDLNQNARERVLRKLRDGHVKLVVATDVAARGIDVPHLSHVINLDLPENKEVYVHRIGRTGRAGRAGTAITIVPPAGRRFIRYIEQALKVTLAAFDVPSDAAVVQFQRENMVNQLAADSPELSLAADWMDSIMADRDWEPDEVAARALLLLAKGHRVPLMDLADCDDTPPAWAKPYKPQKPKKERAPRKASKPKSQEAYARLNEEQIFVAMGRRHGARTADLVGALANEAGISGSEIGQIHVTESASFIGLPREIAEDVLENFKEIQIRGKAISICKSRTRPPAFDGGEEDERAGRGGGGRPFKRGPGGGRKGPRQGGPGRRGPGGGRGYKGKPSGKGPRKGPGGKPFKGKGKGPKSFKGKKGKPTPS